MPTLFWAVFLGEGVFASVLWICAIMFREVEGHADVPVAVLSWQIPQDEKGEKSDWFTVPSWNIPRRKKGKKLGVCKPY